METRLESQSTATAKPQSWLSECIHDAWTDSAQNVRELRGYGAGRLEAAASAELVAGLTIAAGTLEITIGAAALPIHAAGRAMGLCDKERTEQDKDLVKDGAQAFIDAPVVAAYGIYSLFAPYSRNKK